MSKKKEITYLQLQEYVKAKDVCVNAYISDAINKLQQMFIYTGAPDTLNIDAMEEALKVNGCIAIAKVNGGIYALSGTLGGELNAYYEPTKFIVANPYLKLNKEYRVNEDCVIIRNDRRMQGIIPLVGKYAVMCTDAQISLNTAAVLSRITMLIAAPDDKTKASAELFLNKIANGDFSVIGENGFFDGVKMHTAPTANTGYITQLVELMQYYKASFTNEIGLNANYNMKRERLTQGEISVNVDALLPLADNMLYERKKGIEEANKMFGLNMGVSFGSAWKTLHNEEEVATEATETESDVHEPKNDIPHRKTDEEIIDAI